MKEFLGYSVDEVAIRTRLCMLKLSLATTLRITKGSLAMALHMHHDFWYISPTFPAKHDIK